MDCLQCHIEYEPPKFVTTAQYRGGKAKKLNYAYLKYCSRACNLKTRYKNNKQYWKDRYLVKKAEGTLEKRDLATDNPNLPGFQKLAMAVIEIAIEDLKTPKRMSEERLWAQGTAKYFIFEDKKMFEFWCLAAGWNGDRIRGLAREISGHSMEDKNDKSLSHGD